MKPLNTLLTIVLILNFSAHAADKATSVYGGFSEQQKIQNGKAEGPLQVLLTIPEVNAQYQKCQAAKVSIDQIPDCLWKGNEDKDIPKLSDDVKKKVSDLYAEMAKKGPASSEGGRSPASEKSGSGLTGKSKNISIDYMNDPAVVELSKVMQKKLESALLGDEQQRDIKKIAAVDHAKFIELYKTELGKTIVNSFTSYCMESDISNPAYIDTPQCENAAQTHNVDCEIYLISQNKKDTINDNVSSLKTADLSSDKEDSTNLQGKKWTRCIATISDVCYKSNKITNIKSGHDLNESKTKACLIMDYVKSARKNLIAIEEQKKFYDKLAADTASSVKMGLVNGKQVEINEKNSVDAVTTVTSKDIESSYEKKNKEVVQKEIEGCIDQSNQVKDTEACKKFIETDPEEMKKALAEFSLRQNALQENLDKKLENDEEVKKYLEEEGYKKEQIDKLMSKKEDLEAIKKEIKDRFANEKQALIDTMAQKIKGKTTEGNGIDADKDKSKLSQIKAEISSRPDDLKQLVHFSNIVSSYLTVESGGKKSRNVASLFAEVNNSASKIPGADKDAASEIKKNADKAGLKENKGNGDSLINLDVEKLNQLLKYSSEK